MKKRNYSAVLLLKIYNYLGSICQCKTTKMSEYGSNLCNVVMSEMIFQRKNSCNNCYSNRLVDRLQMTENIWKYLVFVTVGQIKQAARIHHLGLSGIIVKNPEKNCHIIDNENEGYGPWNKACVWCKRTMLVKMFAHFQANPVKCDLVQHKPQSFFKYKYWM